MQFPSVTSIFIFWVLGVGGGDGARYLSVTYHFFRDWVLLHDSTTTVFMEYYSCLYVLCEDLMRLRFAEQEVSN